MAHFWQMVFHESKGVGVVVMLTRTHEGGREKCSQYFPADFSDSPMLISRPEVPTLFTTQLRGSRRREETDNGDTLGKINLLESTFDRDSKSEVRKLELVLGSESKIVWHYLYGSWPDFSKPEAEDRAALINLMLETDRKCPSDSPRVVHCSAGVGRTGTFIALDHLLKELESGELLTITDPETDPVFETVNHLREQRMMMVYNEMQLQFIYEVLREQADLKLGNVTEDELRGVQSDTAREDEQSADSAEIANPSGSRSPCDGMVSSRATTPSRSWSGTPEVSDNEP